MLSFYHQCECGERISKLMGNLANFKEQIYDDWQPIVQCPKCGTKYKVKKLPQKNINIALCVGFIVAAVLKLTLKIGFFMGFVIIFGGAFIAAVLMILLDDTFEKVTDEHSAKE